MTSLSSGTRVSDSSEDESSPVQPITPALRSSRRLRAIESPIDVTPTKRRRDDQSSDGIVITGWHGPEIGFGGSFSAQNMDLPIEAEVPSGSPLKRLHRGEDIVDVAGDTSEVSSEGEASEGNVSNDADNEDLDVHNGR